MGQVGGTRRDRCRRAATVPLWPTQWSPPSSEATAIKLQLLCSLWALSEGSGVSLALEPHIDLGFNPGDPCGASSRPLSKVVLTLHSLHFVEIIDDFGITTLHSGEGSESRISLAVQGGEGSEGFREGDPVYGRYRRQGPRSWSGATSYSLCPRRKFCVSFDFKPLPSPVRQPTEECAQSQRCRFTFYLGNG